MVGAAPTDEEAPVSLGAGDVPAVAGVAERAKSTLDLLRFECAGRTGRYLGSLEVDERLVRSRVDGEAASVRAPARVAEILRTLSAQLRTQAERGRSFLIGDRLSALDLYWATFAVLFEPLPEKHCAMPEWLRESYTVKDPTLRAALDPQLLAHRDRIYGDHLELPIEG